MYQEHRRPCTWSQRSSGCGKTHEVSDLFYKGYTNEARRATTSSEVNPASAKRAIMTSVESDGPGIVPSGAGAVALGRPRRNGSRGAPGQLLRPTAPASWILRGTDDYVLHSWVVNSTHKSPGDMIPPNCERNCVCASTMSSSIVLAEYCDSVSWKIIMEPSAPPPLWCRFISLYRSCT
jgi:hypothetical protein